MSPEKLSSLLWSLRKIKAVTLALRYGMDLPEGTDEYHDVDPLDHIDNLLEALIEAFTPEPQPDPGPIYRITWLLSPHEMAWRRDWERRSKF